MMRPRTLRRNQRGVALLLVLWACTLLAILLGGYAALARTEGLQARFQFAQTQAHYAAEAGLIRGIYGMQDPLSKQRWIGDGRIYSFKQDSATIVVSAISESGLVDINTATPEVLQGLFHVVGMEPGAARALAARVLEWRNPVGIVADGATQHAAYVAAGRDYGPRHGPFASVEELQMVLGMTPAVYRRVAGAVTIWSGNPTPNQNIAPPLVLAAIPGMTPPKVNAILAARLKNANDSSLVLNNGTTHSIRSEATLADGTRAVLRATIRFQPGQTGVQPYVVLRWQEGDAE
ncbi:MAG: type II secretion system protein GspK [Rhodanobacter sp.]